MNTRKLVDKVYESFPRKEKFTKKQLAAILETILATISAELIRTNEVQLRGFGVFSIGRRPARNGINPQTLEVIKIRDLKTIKFRPATKTKVLLNPKP